MPLGSAPAALRSDFIRVHDEDWVVLEPALSGSTEHKADKDDEEEQDDEGEGERERAKFLLD
jgi:hypothetical protein